MNAAVILWFQQDLRLADNPALNAAVSRGVPVIPVYIWAPQEEGDWAPGAASRWWLHQSLAELDRNLREHGSRLIVRQGHAFAVLRDLLHETHATDVYWNRRYEPAATERAARITEALSTAGVAVHTHNSALLVEPWELLNRSGEPYQVYTPFKNRLLEELDPPRPLPVPAKIQAPAKWPRFDTLASLKLLPEIPWYTEMAQSWQPGEAGAQLRWRTFAREHLSEYESARNRPAISGTSRLSPHLHFGETGPRQIWHALRPRDRTGPFASELIWREFAYHLLHQFPHTASEPLRSEFKAFPWRRDIRMQRAWERGRTGVPLVDAGMRELWTTGWMHNRVRMVAASFLVKNLLIPWQHGARWFWDTLVDADLANNTLNWQWTAGCGADAAPYFRIFNPMTQGKRFDPDGAYIHRWIPELRSDALWSKTAYPPPIIDVEESRRAALQAYERMKAGAQRGRR